MRQLSLHFQSYVPYTPIRFFVPYALYLPTPATDIIYISNFFPHTQVRFQVSHAIFIPSCHWYHQHLQSSSLTPVRFQVSMPNICAPSASDIIYITNFPLPQSGSMSPCPTFAPPPPLISSTSPIFFPLPQSGSMSPMPYICPSPPPLISSRPPIFSPYTSNLFSPTPVRFHISLALYLPPSCHWYHLYIINDSSQVSFYLCIDITFHLLFSYWLWNISNCICWPFHKCDQFVCYVHSIHFYEMNNIANMFVGGIWFLNDITIKESFWRWFIRRKKSRSFLPYRTRSSWMKAYKQEKYCNLIVLPNIYWVFTNIFDLKHSFFLSCTRDRRRSLFDIHQYILQTYFTLGLYLAQSLSQTLPMNLLHIWFHFFLHRAYMKLIETFSSISFL